MPPPVQHTAHAWGRLRVLLMLGPKNGHSKSHHPTSIENNVLLLLLLLQTCFYCCFCCLTALWKL
jgi:hypothetical protein